MCGRFTQLWTWAELQGYFSMFMPGASNFEPEYNIAPTREIWALMPENDGLKLTRARWGLVPAWWKKPFKDLPSAFNARSESAAERPFFRSAFKQRRCIIPVSGFYEWTGKKGERKPHYFTRQDGKPLFLAGLYEEHTDAETGEITTSTVILTCAANRFMSHFHDRMPVIRAHGGAHGLAGHLAQLGGAAADERGFCVGIAVIGQDMGPYRVFDKSQRAPRGDVIGV